MRHLMISAAVLALLAAPALAQPEEGPGSRGKAVAGHQQAPDAPRAAPAGPAPAPAAGPQNRGGGDRGARGGERGTRGPAPAPVAQPAAPVQTRGNGLGGNRDGRGPNPDMGRNDRGDNRGAGGNDNRGNGFGNRPNNNGYGNNAGRAGYGGQRHDFSGFRDFHRTFNAQHRFRAPSYRRPAGWYDHRWSYGEFLPSAFWARDYWLSDYQDYDLPPPPYGAVWVRVGSDALLIDEDSGEVLTVAYSVFY